MKKDWNVVDWIIEEKYAKNNWQGSAIANGLQLYEIANDPEAQKKRVRLYRDWRKANIFPKDDTASCFAKAIAGEAVPMLEMESPYIANYAPPPVDGEIDFRKAYLNEFTPPDPQKRTRQDIEMLARNNPVIHTALQYVWRGEMSFEEAMIEVVLIYVELVEQRNKEDIEKYKRTTSLPVIFKNLP